MSNPQSPLHDAGARLTRRIGELRNLQQREIRPVPRYAHALNDSIAQKLRQAKWSTQLPLMGADWVTEIPEVLPLWLHWATGGDPNPDIVEKLTSIVDKSRLLDNFQDTARIAESQEEWDKFVSKAYENGAGIAHKWTKVSAPRPRQTASTDRGYGQTSLPPALQADEAEKWGRVLDEETRA